MPDAPTYPPPLTGPTDWLALLGGDGEGGSVGPPRGEAGLPGEHWPKLETIDYLSKLIVLVVLLLALPWLLGKLLTNPGELTGHSAGLAMGPASMGG